MARHVGQIDVQQDQVVIIQLRKIDALFPHVRGINIQVRMGQHHFDAFGCGRIIFDQKDAHIFVSAGYVVAQTECETYWLITPYYTCAN